MPPTRAIHPRRLLPPRLPGRREMQHPVGRRVSRTRRPMGAFASISRPVALTESDPGLQFQPGPWLWPVDRHGTDPAGTGTAVGTWCDGENVRSILEGRLTSRPRPRGDAMRRENVRRQKTRPRRTFDHWEEKKFWKRTSLAAVGEARPARGLEASRRAATGDKRRVGEKRVTFPAINESTLNESPREW